MILPKKLNLTPDTNPNATTTDGLLQCLEGVLKRTVGIQDICEPSSVLGVKPILVGGGTDGASVNISQHNSIKARLLESYTMDILELVLCSPLGAFIKGWLRQSAVSKYRRDVVTALLLI